MAFTIGIISEGPTDQVSITVMLQSFTEDKDLNPAFLQPKPAGDPGNWNQVFSYCASEDFKSAFAFNDFVVIQLDTDFFYGDSVPEHLRITNIEKMDVAAVIAVVKQKLIDQIEAAFYEAHKGQMIFAISTNELECWFLPIYFENNKSKADKIVGCLELLNKELSRRNEGYIHEKKTSFYQKLCKPFKKKKDLLRLSSLNESFAAFIKELEEKLPNNNEPEAAPDASVEAI